MIDHVVVFQRPGNAFTVKHPRKHCVRNVSSDPFLCLHNASTFKLFCCQSSFRQRLRNHYVPHGAEIARELYG